MILKISTIEMFAFHFLPVQEKKGQHLEKISSPSFALSRSHCGRSTRGLWRSARVQRRLRCQAEKQKPPPRTERCSECLIRQQTSHWKKTTEPHLQLLNPTERSSNPSAVCLLMLSSQENESQVRSDSHLKSTRGSQGTRFLHAQFSPHSRHGNHGPPLARSASVS